MENQFDQYPCIIKGLSFLFTLFVTSLSGSIQSNQRHTPVQEEGKEHYIYTLYSIFGLSGLLLKCMSQISVGDPVTVPDSVPALFISPHSYLPVSTSH